MLSNGSLPKIKEPFFKLRAAHSPLHERKPFWLIRILAWIHTARVDKCIVYVLKIGWLCSGPPMRKSKHLGVLLEDFDDIVEINESK